MSRIKRLVRPEKQAYSLKTILACVFAAITCIGVVAHASNRESVKPETHKFEKTQTSDAKMPIAGDGVVLDMRTSSELRPEKLIVTPSSQSPDKDLSSKSNAFHENPSATIESKVEILSPEKIEEIPQQNEKTYFFKAPKIDFTQATCRPEFPLSARRIAPSGVTRVQAMIGEDGRIQKVDIVSSSGFRMLDQAVREALLAPTCVGVPGTINGKAFTAQIRADFNWLGTVDNLGLSSQSLEVQSTLPSTRPANINFEASGCRPEYPANSRKNQEAGLTGLTVSINAEGIVTEARVNKSSGFRGLDNAVVTTLIAGNCKAQPSYVDGNAVHSVIDVSYLWKSN